MDTFLLLHSGYSIVSRVSISAAILTPDFSNFVDLDNWRYKKEILRNFNYQYEKNSWYHWQNCKWIYWIEISCFDITNKIRLLLKKGVRVTTRMTETIKKCLTQLKSTSPTIQRITKENVSANNKIEFSDNFILGHPIWGSIILKFWDGQWRWTFRHFAKFYLLFYFSASAIRQLSKSPRVLDII